MSYFTKLGKNTSPMQWSGSIPVEFRYTAGVAGEAFFRSLKDEGRLRGTRCDSCAVTYVPARLFCERCFSQLDHWVDVSLEGELYSYTVTHFDLKVNPLARPRVFGLVRLYHADTVLFHEVLADKNQLRIGMKVKALLKPANLRKGAITDIRGFVPKG